MLLQREQAGKAKKVVTNIRGNFSVPLIPVPNQFGTRATGEVRSLLDHAHSA